jgi:hypothetical protein
MKLEILQRFLMLGKLIRYPGGDRENWYTGANIRCWKLIIDDKLFIILWEDEIIK